MLAKSVKVMLLMCLWFGASLALPRTGRVEVRESDSDEVESKEAGGELYSSLSPLTEAPLKMKRSPVQGEATAEGIKEGEEGQDDEECCGAKEGVQKGDKAFKRAVGAELFTGVNPSETLTQRVKAILQTGSQNPISQSKPDRKTRQTGTGQETSESQGGNGKEQTDSVAAGNQELSSSSDAERKTRGTQGENDEEGKEPECCGANPCRKVDKRDTAPSKKDCASECCGVSSSEESPCCGIQRRDGEVSGEDCDKQCCGAKESKENGSE